jgi:iron complex transport system permease protein
MVARHRSKSLKRWRLLCLLLGALGATSAVAVSIGSADLSAAEVGRALIGAASSPAERIVWFIRLPRVVAAMLAGAGLAVAGAAMQSLLRNPLGSPFTLGLSQAAAFGAALAIVVFGAGRTQSSAADAVVLDSAWLVSGLAFLLALCAAGALVLLARLRGSSPETMILAGVALASLFAAGVTGLEYVASDVEIASIVFWTFGDVGRVGWPELVPMGAVISGALIYFLLRAWSLNALDGGDESARSLGVNASRLRLEGMLVASLATATVVALVGIIGFVGLIVPHMVRRAIGGDERFLLPASALGGALLLLVADLAARNLLAPITVPVGVLTSFLGAPLFFYLVVRGRSYW